MFIEKYVKIVHPFQGFLYFAIFRNNKTICLLETDKIRIALLFNDYYSMIQ